MDIEKFVDTFIPPFVRGEFTDPTAFKEAFFALDTNEATKLVVSVFKDKVPEVDPPEKLEDFIIWLMRLACLEIYLANLGKDPRLSEEIRVRLAAVLMDKAIVGGFIPDPLSGVNVH